MTFHVSLSTARAIGLAAALLAAATGSHAAAPVAPAASAAATSNAAATLPADSVYQLAVALTDQDGHTQAWAERRGRPMLVSLFYTSCQFVCPMLVEALADTRAQLAPDVRGRLPVTLVSFDPAHDSVAVLKRTATQRQLDPAAWTLARTDARSVRQLAAVLGIQYRALANGEFNHSTALILLDADGRIVARTHKLGSADPAFVQQVAATLRAAGP